CAAPVCQQPLEPRLRAEPGRFRDAPRDRLGRRVERAGGKGETMTRGWRRAGAAIAVVLFTLQSAAAARFELAWPTPDTAWSEGRPRESFLMHAGSGDPMSGGVGGVRSGGREFEEGIDIKPVRRDRRRAPRDEVFAAMAGVVRHVNSSAGASSYGRYVVLEHVGEPPAVYTLYAHLAKVAAGI